MSKLPQETSPLMQAIQFNGGIYFTSQYFHKMYGNNGGKKYEQLQHFNRLIRSIETYQDYIDRGDIIELTKDEAGLNSQPASKAGPICGLADSNFESVLKATFGKPILPRKKSRSWFVNLINKV